MMTVVLIVALVVMFLVAMLFCCLYVYYFRRFKRMIQKEQYKVWFNDLDFEMRLNREEASGLRSAIETFVYMTGAKGFKMKKF